MATFLSPTIKIEEVDVSHVPTVGSGVIPAFIGTASKGPLNTPVYITNSQEAIDTFGEPLDDSDLMQAYLAYTQKAGKGNAWIMRVGIEYEAGMSDALLNVCIDNTNKKYGWGRIALFKGIAKGKLCFREISSDNPVSFHDASVSNITFNGVANGTLTFSSEDYDGDEDEVFTITVTSDPTNPTDSNIHGATYKITNSDGNVITSGTFDDSDLDDVSTNISFNGMTFTASATGTYPIQTGDFWTFNAQTDNKTFSFSVDGGTATTYSFSDGDSYTSASDFVDAINTLITASAPYVAVVSNGYACIQTDNYGERIQFMSTPAFASEVGLALYSIDIPRAHFINSETGPFTISSSNDEFNMIMTYNDTDYEFSTSIVHNTYTNAELANFLNSNSYYNGDKYWNAYTINYLETDGSTGTRLVIEADDSYEYSQLKIQADYSHINVLHFVDDIGFNYPYTSTYSSFYDSRTTLPTQSTTTPGQPASCDSGPCSQCTIDSDYYQNIVGFIVAKYPGTWINDFTITLEPQYNNATNSELFTLKIYDSGVEVDKIEDVGFDATDTTTYIANKINAGTTGGGVNGNAYIMWEERPTILDNDSSLSSYDARTPGAITGRSFSGGANGIPPSATYSTYLDKAIVGNQALGTGIYKFANSDVYYITVIAIPGITSGSVITSTINMCQNRGDCMYVIDPPFGLTYKQVVDWHNGVLSGYDILSAFDTSYAALFWSWQKWFNNFSGEYVYIPPSGFVIGTISYSEEHNEVWYPPAGINRGILTTAIDVEYNPNEAERDLLYGYNNAVNPIVKNSNGISIQGQRTLQRADTALDRINVRLLVNEIKIRCRSILESFKFEFNDEPTRSRVTSILNSMMGDIAVGRGVTEYKVICDETNNTPTRIEHNELHVTILFKPNYAIEFIGVKLGILNQSQSIAMEEILANAGLL